MILVYD